MANRNLFTITVVDDDRLSDLFKSHHVIQADAINRDTLRTSDIRATTTRNRVKMTNEPIETDIWTDAMHVRASMLTDIPGLASTGVTPDDDRVGMLHHSESIQEEERLSGFVRTPSVAFRQGEAATMQRVLEEVDKAAAKRMKDGFNELNFSAGVLNAFLVCYVFGRFPEHFWLLYYVETLILVPTKFAHMVKAKPLNEALYYLDLCWFLNFVGMLALSVFPLFKALGISISDDLRKHLYLAVVGSTCGPLLGATILLPFVAFLFHDIKTMTGLYIHVLPPMVAYTFRWHASEIREAWPELFSLSYLDDVRFFPETGPLFLPGSGLETVAGNAIAVYFLWFVPYVIWMVVVGMDLPRSNRRGKDGKLQHPKFDTVFHSTVRGGICITIGKVFWGRSKAASVKQMESNDFEHRDFVAYMAFHAGLSILSIYGLAYPCFSSKTVHLCLIVLLMVLSVYRGSKRYTYYSTAMYGRLIRKQFDLIVMEESKRD